MKSNTEINESRKVNKLLFNSNTHTIDVLSTIKNPKDVRRIDKVRKTDKQLFQFLTYIIKALLYHIFIIYYKSFNFIHSQKSCRFFDAEMKVEILRDCYSSLIQILYKINNAEII